MAIVHSHSPAVIPFSVSNVPMRPVLHMADFLLRVLPVFEPREVDGEENDMLVRNARLGAAPGGNVTDLYTHEVTTVGEENDRQTERPWELWKRRVEERSSIRHSYRFGMDSPVIVRVHTKAEGPLSPTYTSYSHG